MYVHKKVIMDMENIINFLARCHLITVTCFFIHYRSSLRGKGVTLLFKLKATSFALKYVISACKPCMYSVNMFPTGEKIVSGLLTFIGAT